MREIIAFCPHGKCLRYYVSMRVICAFLAVSTLAAQSEVIPAISRFENGAAKTPPLTPAEYRRRATQIPRERYREQAGKLLDEAVAALKGHSVPSTSSIPRLMKELAPNEPVALDRNLPREPIDAALSKKI